MTLASSVRALSLGLLLVCSLASAGDEAPMVASVELHLPPGSDPSGLAERIAVRRGHPLSLRDVRRSMERLFATGRFADVVVRSFPAGEDVRIVFEITPKRRIASLEVIGARVLTPPEVLAAARLAEGGECYPEVLDEAAGRVAQLYRRKGYRDAQIAVELQEAPKGLDVLLTVDERWPTPVLGVTVGGNPGLPIQRIEEALGLGQGMILDQDQLDAGIERLKALYRDEGFYRARLGEPEILDGKSGATIALPITAGPRYEFRFHGNRSFPDKLLRSILDYDGSETLDDGMLARMSRRLSHFYQYRGFNDVRVVHREVRSPNQSRGIIAFDVEEGPLLFVDEIHFEGNKVLADDQLLEILERRVQAGAPVPRDDVGVQLDPLGLEGDRAGERIPSPQFDPRRVWVEAAWEEAARAMGEAYRERGYLRASVALQTAEIDVARSSARVTYRISEGLQSRVAGIKYLGLPPGFDPSSAVRVQLGDVFRNAEIDDASRSLVRALGRQGYLFARVDGESGLSTDGREVRVIFKVETGPRVRVGQVIVRGLKRTTEELVRANMVAKEGAVLDPEALFESQRNLILLGSFRSAAVKLISPEVVEETKDVVVEVRERPRLSGEIGGGYSLVDGPRLVGDLAYPNLAGTGMSLSGRLKVNYVGASAQVLSGDGKSTGIDPSAVAGFGGFDYRGNVSLAYPRIYTLLPAKLGARFDLIAERAHRPSYTLQRVAAVTGLDWEARRWLTFSLQYELENDDVRLPSRTQELLPNVAPTDIQWLRFPSGDFPLQSLRPTVTLDFRDDVARPTRGVLFSGSAEWTNDFGAMLINPSGESPLHIHTVKVSESLTGYVPVAPRTVLALSLRGGKIVHLTEDSESIAPKRFFLGGSTSMRGFSEEGIIPQDRRADLRNEVLNQCPAPTDPNGCTANARVLKDGRQLPSEGGELYTLLKSELRLPAFGPFDLGLFFEAGNLWLDPAKYQPLVLRYVTGAGVRYGTPIGPLALDLGINLFPDTVLNEPRANLHFSIGLF